ncbi:CRAL-TRIO domain-containing protein [Gaertneriomyces semiglobifer]|nr:CRAL-TRIO domain-containing protein [Gaertneriomyces semiglobifer]
MLARKLSKLSLATSASAQASSGDLAKTHAPIVKHPNPPPVPPNWPRHNSTPEQIALLEEFKTKLPNLLSSDETQRLKEEAWADDACLLRYLRATKWKLDESVTRLENTLQWRREYKPDEINMAEIEPEAVTGKQFINGFDREGRPILHLIPRKQNTKTYDRQLRFVVWGLERAIRVMPPGVESLVLLVDYEKVSVMSSPPASQSKKVLEILGNHYPERLGMGFMINPTWYLWVFFKIIGPFLDPVTREKIHFVDLKKQAEVNKREHDEKSDAGSQEKDVTIGMGGWTNIRHYIAPELLSSDYGGTYNYEYDHQAYWDALKNL